MSSSCMFKGNRKYYLVLVLIFTGVVFLYYSQPKPINWSRTFGKDDKIPFGCYAIFHLLEQTYGGRVTINSQGLYHLAAGEEKTPQTLLLINSDLDLDRLEVRSLFDYVKRGNTVLLCADHFGRSLCDTFQLVVEYNVYSGASSLDSLLKKPAFEVSYVQPANNVMKSYMYPEAANKSFFSSLDTARFRISAINKRRRPVMLEADLGKGKLILSTLPDVFGNLFIVNHPNRSYVYTLLSKLKNETVIWDEYYKTFGRHKQSMFAFIFSSDALYMAYSITVLSILLFMLFGIKRRQRAIPVITPPRNTTLEFVDVVSQVYFNSNNHQHIAAETIRYFYAEISRKFQLNTANLDESFFMALHQRSGVDLEQIRKLFMFCQVLKASASLTEHDLLELNDRITQFKTQSIR